MKYRNLSGKTTKCLTFFPQKFQMFLKRKINDENRAGSPTVISSLSSSSAIPDLHTSLLLNAITMITISQWFLLLTTITMITISQWFQQSLMTSSRKQLMPINYQKVKVACSSERIFNNPYLYFCIKLWLLINFVRLSGCNWEKNLPAALNVAIPMWRGILVIK